MRYKSIFLLLLLIAFRSSFSQVEYEPLVDTTKQWNILESKWKDYYTRDVDNTVSIRFRGDTLVEGVHYYFIEKCINDSTFSKWERKKMLIREEVSNQCVYYRESSHEYLIYDFSLGEGDTLQTIDRHIVDSVAYEYIGGKQRKVLYFSSGPDARKIIEGIGSLEDILGPYRWSMTGEDGWNLLCYYQDGSLIFQNMDTCYFFKDYTSILDKYNQALFSITPNPTTDILRLRANTDLLGANVRLYSVLGNLILEKELSGSQETITASDLNPGLYFIIICRDNFSLYKQKIIKK